LIVKPPKDEKQLKGGGQDARPTDDRSTALVELIDIAPTILDYARLPAPQRIQGESFRPIIEGSSDASDHKQQVLCEYTNNDKTQSGKCIRTQRYKYAYWDHGRGAELYD